MKWQDAIVLVAGIILGAWGMHTWTESDRHRPPIVQEKIVTQTETKWHYGKPKETVKYVDRVTGQETALPVDMKYTFNKPEFVFTVNGKAAKFTKADDERFVFDKNMGSMTQASTVSIDIRAPEQRPGIKVGVYAAGGQGASPEGGIEIATQSKRFDLDLDVNHKKEIKAKATWWIF